MLLQVRLPPGVKDSCWDGKVSWVIICRRTGQTLPAACTLTVARRVLVGRLARRGIALPTREADIVRAAIVEEWWRGGKEGGVCVRV
jgi:hypothetical protein